MSIWEAIIFGIIQGLTEFLPVSSSGHLELANYLFGIQEPSNLQFTMALHAGTVLSTIVVFRKELGQLIAGFFRFRMSDQMRFVINLLISLIPIMVVGLFFGDWIESLFTSNIRLVGIMLIVTAVLLTFAYYAKPKNLPVTPWKAFVIGLSQAVAVLPGLSRSGSTISTGLMLGVRREEVSKFSFLMVLIPILGMNFLEAMKMPSAQDLNIWPLAVGFVTAFVAGLFACRWMIRLVNRGKLVWFALYCLIVGAAAIVMSVL